MGKALGIFAMIFGAIIILVGLGLLAEAASMYEGARTIFQQQTGIQMAMLSIVVFVVAAAIFYGAKRTWPKGEW